MELSARGLYVSVSGRRGALITRCIIRGERELGAHGCFIALELIIGRTGD